MECPKCRYALSPFDVNCPRCKNFADLGIPVPDLTVAADVVDVNPASSIAAGEDGASTGLIKPEEPWYSKLDLGDTDPAADTEPRQEEHSVPVAPAVSEAKLPPVRVKSHINGTPLPPAKLAYVPPSTVSSSKTYELPVKNPIFVTATLVIIGLIWFVVHAGSIAHGQNEKAAETLKDAQHPASQVNVAASQFQQVPADAKAQDATALNAEVASSIARDKDLTLTDQQAASIRAKLRVKCRLALDDCAQVLQNDPSNAVALAERVRALRYLGNAKSADVSLSNALKVCPNNPLLLELKGHPR